MINFKWNIQANAHGTVVGVVSQPINSFVVVIKDGFYKLLKKKLDGRRIVVIRFKVRKDFNKVLARVTGIYTTPYDETLRFLSSCEKYMKLN